MMKKELIGCSEVVTDVGREEVSEPPTRAGKQVYGVGSPHSVSAVILNCLAAKEIGT